MKKYLPTFLFAATTIFVSLTTQAQTDDVVNKAANAVSANGYWVVESNKNTPKESVVYFYNNANILVYKEEIKDRKLKLQNEKTLAWLKASLEAAVYGYERGTWASRRNSRVLN